MLKVHYNCARMNSLEGFTPKELRSALRSAGLSMGPGARFRCDCGIEYVSSVTFSVHLMKCFVHKIRYDLALHIYKFILLHHAFAW